MTAYENSISNIIAGQQALWNRVTNADPLRTTTRLVYNAGIAKEAYFRNTSPPGANVNTRLAMSDVVNNRTGLWKILQTDSAGNDPTTIDFAANLWSKSQSYKGMISASRHKEAAPASDDKTAAKTNPLIVSERSDGKFYGFQFHYNPGSLAMAWGGPQPVDVSLMASGREKFISFGSGAGAGTISLNLILNRINDMKYIDPKTGRLKAGVSTTAFSGRPPTNAEVGDIYNRGTMYDLEFLLRTVLGYEYQSALGRGMSWDKKTADLGWLGGKPVEIHLGKSLRYLGRVASLSVNHVLFTERMVPTFSEVSIVIARLPDVTSSQIQDNSTGNEPVLSQTAKNIIAGVGSY
jgi:hypothetical protein